MTDAERLDWLEQHPEFTLRKYKRNWFCIKATTNYEFNVYPTMREPIDAAINGTWQE